MPLVKMSMKDIKQFQPKEPSIDPYSSLEDVRNTDDEDGEPEDDDHDSDVAQSGQYFMQECRTIRQRHSSKPLRENRMPVNYVDMIGSDHESCSLK